MPEPSETEEVALSSSSCAVSDYYNSSIEGFVGLNLWMREREREREREGGVGGGGGRQRQRQRDRQTETERSFNATATKQKRHHIPISSP